MLPTFLIIGSQKAGTTSLYNVLRKHPQIFMPEIKEINFFFHERLYKRGIDFYKQYFMNGKKNSNVIGEASPGYICHPKAPKRIKKHLPDIKLILTVRNPIERAYSQYGDNRRKLSESLTFEETLSVALSDVYEPGQLGYFSRGVYITYIKRYLEYFDRKQLLILVFDDLVDNPLSFYKRCFRFLYVDDSFECPEIQQKSNPSSIWNNPIYKFFFRNPKYSTYFPARLRRLLYFGRKIPYQYPPMDEATKRRLVEFYEAPNNDLSRFIGRNLDHWNE
jgi:hypothetical protein